MKKLREQLVLVTYRSKDCNIKQQPDAFSVVEVRVLFFPDKNWQNWVEERMCRSGEFVRKIRITPHHHYLAMTKLRSFVSYVSLIAILNHVGQVGRFCSREQLQLLLHSFRQEKTPTNWYQKKQVSSKAN